MTQHLLSIEDLDRAGIVELLDGAEHMSDVLGREIPKVPALRGKTVVSLFFEDSTRTRTSFDTAARRLSADVMNFSVSSSEVWGTIFLLLFVGAVVGAVGSGVAVSSYLDV